MSYNPPPSQNPGNQNPGYQNPGYQPNPYGDAGYGAYAAPPKTAVMGWIAFGAAVMALLVSVGCGIVVWYIASQDMGPEAAGMGGIVALSLVAPGLLLSFALGLWAIIQGIVAAVQDRGRMQGIGGIVLGVIGPWVGVIIAVMMAASGLPPEV